MTANHVAAMLPRKPRMRGIAVGLVVPVTIGGAVGAAWMWRRHPRVGTAFVNTVVNPTVLGRGRAGSGRSEIATLEHIGRRSGVLRLTPVHPEATPFGFRILVPLGTQSEWARNVVAAGHCRIQLHDQVFDLAQPVMVDARAATHQPRPVRSLMAALGFAYLELRTSSPDTETLVQGDPVSAEPDRSRDAGGSALVAMR